MPKLKVLPPPVLKYRRVEVAGTGDRVSNSFKILTASGISIADSDVGGIGLANLRSAVHRASASRGLQIETLADEKNFYVRKKSETKQFSLRHAG